MQAKPNTVVVLNECGYSYIIKELPVSLSLAICILAWVASTLFSRAADSPPVKNIPILYGFTDRKALGDLVFMRSTLRSHITTPVNFDVDYFESTRSEAEGYQESLSDFPTDCILNYCFDHAVIGGSYPDSDNEAVRGGELGARVLPGEKAENISVSHDSVARVNVDGRQLRRWNIPESSLPTGTIVLFRRPTIWEHYQSYHSAGIALIIIQGLLILGLLTQRARKRHTEIRLRESEERFRAMAEITPCLVWMCNKDGRVTYLNERWIDFPGRNSTDGFGDTWATVIHPDDLQSVFNANRLALEQRTGFSKEYRLRRRDGVYRWMFDVASPRVNGDGTFGGFIGSATDITDQKLAQEALEKINGRLIAAQEKERSRIARELHDDICQRLALLSLELTHVIMGSSGANDTANMRITEIWQHCSEIAGAVQALSHELHSSKLDYLGIVAALASFCREFSKQHNVNIEFTHDDVPDSLTGELSLCFFRVAQEALHNAVKYSGVSHFSVDLRRTADQLQLEVRDAGAGFDLEQAKSNEGLGLVSMQERVHLMNGTFTIETRANHGTRILVRVPWVGEANTIVAGAFVR